MVQFRLQASPARIKARVRQDLDSRIIFNHVPKAGGSSLYYFFQDLFGEDRVFRYRTRNFKDRIIAMEDLSRQQLARYKVFQGHFAHGYHMLVPPPMTYFGIVRDPIDRIASNYQYLRMKGKPEDKDYANSVSFSTFFEERFLQNGPGIGSFQTKFLTGTREIKAAKKVLAKQYLLCCATEQLDDCQRLLATLFGKPELAPIKRNVTSSSSLLRDETAALKAAYARIFAIDYGFVDHVRREFDRRLAALEE